MHRLFFGLNSAEVPHSAARIFFSVAVQQLAPETSYGNSEAITDPGNRGKVTNRDNWLAKRFSLPHPRQRAGNVVVAVDPLETLRIGIEFVQGWLFCINPIQLL